MKFEMPESLDGLTLEELTAHATAVETEFGELVAELGDGTPSVEQLTAMEDLTAAGNALAGRIGEVQDEEQKRADRARELIEARTPPPEDVEEEAAPEDQADDDTDGDGGDGGEVVAEAETITAEAAEPAVTASARKVSFKGHGARTGRTPSRVAKAAPSASEQAGFRMRDQVPAFTPGVVGFGSWLRR